MILLQAEHLQKTHGMKVIFDDISVYISNGDKIGLIGVNGTGKSTLLRILAGLDAADAGEITTSNELVVEYLPQHPDFDEDATVLEQVFRGESPFMQVLRAYEETLDALEAHPEDAALTEKLLKLSERMDEVDAWQLESEAKSILNKLGVSDFSAKVSTLSGGQRKRIALAGALIRPCNLLILDEPTNHLDNDTIEYLENMLKNKNVALLMVTHDRYFLDRVTNRILELDQAKLYSYDGNYAVFLEQKAQREAATQRIREKERSLYRQELEWMRKGVEARRTKQKARIERFNELEGRLTETTEDKLEITVAGARLGKKIIELEHVHKAYGERVCVDDLTYAVVRSDRIGIIGNNGLGKSTLLNMIAGREMPDSGTIAIGETVRIGYYTQDNREMDPEQRVIDYVRERGEFIDAGDGTVISAAKMLERFMFPGALQHSTIGQLSGGEKRRLYLLGILMGNVNVLLLDEPTNDLDIQTLQILEDFIDHFAGPVLTVSHDRYFLDRTCEKIFAFEGSGVVDIHTGNYSDYAERRQTMAPADKTPAAEKPAKETTHRPPREAKVKFSYKEAREYETSEADIDALEQAIARAESDMAANSSDFVRLNELMAEKERLEEELLEKMERWEYLSQIAEQMRQ